MSFVILRTTMAFSPLASFDFTFFDDHQKSVAPGPAKRLGLSGHVEDEAVGA